MADVSARTRDEAIAWATSSCVIIIQSPVSSLESAVVIMRDSVDTHSTGLLELSKTVSLDWLHKQGRGLLGPEVTLSTSSEASPHICSPVQSRILKYASLLLCYGLSKSLRLPELLRVTLQPI